MDKELHNIHTRILEQRMQNPKNKNNKELEALKRLFDSNTENSHEDYDLLYKAILELKAIKEAKPNEALKKLECLYVNARIESGWVKKRCITYAEEFEHNDRIKPYYETIRQALLKAQDDKQFIDLILNKPQLLNVFTFDGIHTWEEFEDTFSDKDKEYINTTKEEFEYMRNQLISRGRINE